MHIDIVTYNILANAYVKRERYPHSTPEALDAVRRRALLLKTITELDADILCLQEVESEAFSAISAVLPNHQGTHAQAAGRPDGLAVFARTPFVAHEIRDPGFDPSLVAQVVEFDRFSLVNTHLRWRPDNTPDHEHTGLQQLRRILRDCDAKSGAWIVAGDFNANSQSKVLVEAEHRGYRNSCRSQRPWDTTNINGRRRKIDYLLHTPQHWKPEPGILPELGRRTPMPSETHASDHLPLKVRFTRLD